MPWERLNKVEEIKRLANIYWRIILISFEGSIEEIIFHNEENGYTVADMVSDDQLFTITGSMPYVYVGENLQVTGEWQVHKTYGRQFMVTSV